MDGSLRRSRLTGEASKEQRAAVQEICSRVAEEGDRALFEFERRFDGWAPAAGEALAVDAEQPGRPPLQLVEERDVDPVAGVHHDVGRLDRRPQGTR